MLLDISDKIKLVLSETGFTYCNCLFIDDDVKTIIDTGADYGSLQQIQPASVDRVINSHHHIDHTRGNKYFPVAKIAIHEFDAAALSDINNFEYYNSLDQWHELMPEIDYLEIAKQIGLYFEDFVDISVDELFRMVNGWILGNYQRIHTPGFRALFFWFSEEVPFCGIICLLKRAR